jgi:hypothetical protein
VESADSSAESWLKEVTKFQAPLLGCCLPVFKGLKRAEGPGFFFVHSVPSLALFSMSSGLICTVRSKKRFAFMAWLSSISFILR